MEKQPQQLGRSHQKKPLAKRPSSLWYFRLFSAHIYDNPREDLNVQTVEQERDWRTRILQNVQCA